MAKILKNTTGSTISIGDTGVGLAASPAQYTIPELDYLLWAESSDIETKITSGDVVVNDGVADLSVTDGINFIKYPDTAFNVRFLSETERANGLSSKNVQDAIEEVKDLAEDSSKSYIFAQYNGQANTGRYLEVFEGIDMEDAPLHTIGGFDVLTIVSETTSSSETCTIGWFDISGGTPGTLLHTTTFTAQKLVVEDGGTVFSVPANAALAIKVNGGNIIKPHIYFVIRGAG